MKKEPKRKTDPTDLERARLSLVREAVATGVLDSFSRRVGPKKWITFELRLSPSPLDPDGELREKHGPDALRLESVLRSVAVLKEIGTEDELREKFSRLHEAQRLALDLHRVKVSSRKIIDDAAKNLEGMKFCYDFLAGRARDFEGDLENNGFRFDPEKKVAASIPKGRGRPLKILNGAIVVLYRELRKKFQKEPEAHVRREIRDRLAHFFPIDELDDELIAETITNLLRRPISVKPSRKT